MHVRSQPIPSPEVEISITSIADAITLETPFPATVTVTNKFVQLFALRACHAKPGQRPAQQPANVASL
jgi:hypothetical protein